MDVVFKALDKEHLEWARLLHNDPEVLAVLTTSSEVSKKQQEVWFSGLQKSVSSKRLLVFSDGEVVGLIRLDQIDYVNKSVRIGLDIHRDFRGKKLAKPIYFKLFKDWFLEQGFNRLWLLVTSYNTRALNLYKSLGFKEEGVQREALLKKGIFYDYIMMSILREEYDDTAL